MIFCYIKITIIFRTCISKAFFKWGYESTSINQICVHIDFCSQRYLKVRRCADPGLMNRAPKNPPSSSQVYFSKAPSPRQRLDYSLHCLVISSSPLPHFYLAATFLSCLFTRPLPLGTSQNLRDQWTIPVSIVQERYFNLCVLSYSQSILCRRFIRH